MRHCVVYGVGEIVKQNMRLISDNYIVDFYVDRDKSKIGKEVDGRIVHNPRVLCNYNETIIVASYAFYDIIRYIKYDLRIDNEICIVYCANSVDYEIIPWDDVCIDLVDNDLIELDLKNNQETDSPNKTMLFCSSYSVYTERLVKNLTRYIKDIEVSVVTSSKMYLEIDELVHVYYFDTMSRLKTILNSLPYYNSFQLLWIEFPWIYYRDTIRAKCKLLNICIGGSDFFRSNDSYKSFMRMLLTKSDCVSGETEETIRLFGECFDDLDLNLQVVPFGMDVVEHIIGRQREGWTKEYYCRKFDFPVDKLTVMIGHNAIRAQNHIEQIESLMHFSDEIKNEIFLIVPMTYGGVDHDYYDEVKNALERSGFFYSILRDFLNDDEMACLALATDVMVHVQTTDQLSSTMIEHMCANNIIISGSWLPYGSLEEYGIRFLKVDRINDVNITLKLIIDNMDYYCKEFVENNKNVIESRFLWKNVIKKWERIIFA